MNKQVLNNQKFYSRVTRETHLHRTIILDPGCSQFGQLPNKPYQKKVRVMFDFTRQAWVKAEI